MRALRSRNWTLRDKRGKPRIGVVSTTIDHAPWLLQYDVREDEEQNVKLTECIDLLLAAGYFRARIKGLTPFDKVYKLYILHY